MQEANRQTSAPKRPAGSETMSGPHSVHFQWKHRPPMATDASLLRKVRRSIGGLLAYGATFYRTAAK
jgi:hypothetical protein